MSAALQKPNHVTLSEAIWARDLVRSMAALYLRTRVNNWRGVPYWNIY